jgi:hypothetical protein
MRLGGHQDRCGRLRKLSPSPIFDVRTVHPVVSRYKDYALWGVNLNMKTGGYFETSAPIYEVVERHIPQDGANVNVIL